MSSRHGTLLHRHSKRATISQISSFLNAHNNDRSLHNAEPLKWSSSLASKAQEWAAGCQFQHSDGSLSDTPYGENIVAASGNFPVQSAVQTFIETKLQYSSLNPTYNQWTQVVWKDTKELGCAVSTCDSIFDQSYGPATMVVCLYSPAGNVVGQIQYALSHLLDYHFPYSTSPVSLCPGTTLKLNFFHTFPFHHCILSPTV
ncbi:PR-1-like protein [Marasmius fiardii PR-910]|nr:PR-1-like protein [Marasmius fiardii PR-910]